MPFITTVQIPAKRVLPPTYCRAWCFLELAIVQKVEVVDWSNNRPELAKMLRFCSLDVLEIHLGAVLGNSVQSCLVFLNFYEREMQASKLPRLPLKILLFFFFSPVTFFSLISYLCCFSSLRPQVACTTVTLGTDWHSFVRTDSASTCNQFH